MRTLPIAFALIALYVPSQVLAPEFWIEPFTFQVGSRGKITGELTNGQEFASYRLGKILLRSKNIILNVPVPYGYWDPPKTIINHQNRRKIIKSTASSIQGSGRPPFAGATLSVCIRRSSLEKAIRLNLDDS